MKTKQWLQSFVAFAVVAFVAAGCANQMEPAKKAIADIEAAVAAAGDDAAKYIPDEVSAVNDKVASLKAQLTRRTTRAHRRGPGGGAGAGAGSQRSQPQSMDALNGSGARSQHQSCRYSAIQAASTSCRSRRNCLPGSTRRRSNRPRRGSPRPTRCGRRPPRPSRRATSSRRSAWGARPRRKRMACSPLWA
jgi:hypothetical protein